VAAQTVRKEQLQKYARTYLEDMAFSFLLDFGLPAVAADIAESIPLKKGSSARLLRQILSQSSRFATAGRGWEPACAEIDHTYTLERALEMTVLAAGRPVPISAVAKMLSKSRKETPEGLEGKIRAVLGSSRKVVLVDGETLAHKDWLLATGGLSEDDIRFLNFRGREDDLETLQEAKKTPHDTVSAATLTGELLRSLKRPISNKVLGYLLWQKQHDRFDAVAHMKHLLHHEEFVFLSSGHWVDRSLIADMEKCLQELEASITDEAEEKAEGKMATKQRAAIEVTPGDLNEVEKMLRAASHPVETGRVLERLFDFMSGEKGYEEARARLHEALERDSRFARIGAEKWDLRSRLPHFVFSTPPHLGFKRVVVHNMEGEEVDPYLLDDGFEGNLNNDILNVYLEDVGDADHLPQYDPTRPVRLVTKYYHALGDTFPLCQIPVGFFNDDSPLAHYKFMCIDERMGEKKRLEDLNVWVNREQQVMYGFSPLYEMRAAPVHRCGTIMTLERTENPDIYKLTITPDVEPDLYVSPKRMAELETLRNTADDAHEPWALFQIVVNVLQHHKSGASFGLILTEVGIVRNTKRRQLASLLSSFHCFYQKEPDLALWHYDERKVSQGFKKAKRKYVTRFPE
jgi:hypothetical protein